MNRLLGCFLAVLPVVTAESIDERQPISCPTLQAALERAKPTVQSDGTTLAFYLVDVAGNFQIEWYMMSVVDLEGLELVQIVKPGAQGIIKVELGLNADAIDGSVVDMGTPQPVPPDAGTIVGSFTFVGSFSRAPDCFIRRRFEVTRVGEAILVATATAIGACLSGHRA